MQPERKIGVDHRRLGDARRALGLVCVLIGVTLMASCAPLRTVRIVTLDELESAERAAIMDRQCVTVADPDALRGLYRPISRRAGFIEVRSAADWSRLLRACPALATEPDFRHGVVVALAVWAGEPLDGRFPVELSQAKVSDGAALVSYSIAGGNYLPDGATYLHAAYVEGARNVLVVEVNGARFYPE